MQPLFYCFTNSFSILLFFLLTPKRTYTCLFMSEQSKQTEPVQIMTTNESTTNESTTNESASNDAESNEAESKKA